MKVDNNLNISKSFEVVKKMDNISEIKQERVIVNIWDTRLKKDEEVSLEYRLDKIAKKVARGDFVSGEEKELLAKYSPDKLQKAAMAHKRKIDVEIRLKGAKSKNEARAIISEAKVEMHQVFTKKDEVYAELLSAAIDELTEDYLGNKSVQYDTDASRKTGSHLKGLDIKI